MWGLNYANWIIYIIQTTRENNKNAFQFFSVWLINAQYFTTLCDFIFRVHDKSIYDMDLTTTSGTSNLMYVHCLMIIPSENQDAQLFFLCHLFSCHFLVSARGHIVMVPPDLQVQRLPFSFLWLLFLSPVCECGRDWKLTSLFWWLAWSWETLKPAHFIIHSLLPDW